MHTLFASGAQGGGGPAQWPTLHRRFEQQAQPAGPPARTRRRGRGRWIGALSLILAAAALFAWWQSYKRGPAYSLALAVDAARRDDADAFDAMVDADQIVENFDGQGQSGEPGLSLPGLLGQGLDAVAPGVAASGRQFVRSELRRQVKELSSGAEGKPPLLIALGISYGGKFVEEGDRATATLEIDGRPVDLWMRRSGDDRWKVIAVKGDAVAERALRRAMQ